MTKDEIEQDIIRRACNWGSYEGDLKKLSPNMTFAKDFNMSPEDIGDFFASVQRLNSISPTEQELAAVTTIEDLANLLIAHQDKRWFQDGIEIIIDDAKLYYSRGDEACFFGWLHSIYGVKNVIGLPEGLTLKIQNLDYLGLHELIAVTSRYEINQKSLAALCLPENEEWFKDKEAYWYEGVFGA